MVARCVRYCASVPASAVIHPYRPAVTALDELETFAALRRAE